MTQEIQEILKGVEKLSIIDIESNIDSIQYTLSKKEDKELQVLLDSLQKELKNRINTNYRI